MAADIGPPPGNVASGASLEDSRQSARSQAFIAPAFVAAMQAGHQVGTSSTSKAAADQAIAACGGIINRARTFLKRHQTA